MSVVFMCGLPRSGTTLLMNILGQNPKIYPTPTNGLINMVVHMKENWHNDKIFQALDPKYITPKIKNMLKGTINGFYQNQIDQNQIAIDKNRGWVAYIDLLEEIYGHPVKIIYPVRDIVEIIGSFEKLHQKSTLVNRTNNRNLNWINQQSIDGRAANLLRNEDVLGLAIVRLNEIINRHQTSKILFVHYDDIINKTSKVLNKVHNYLELDDFVYNLDNIEQLTNENDLFHSFEDGTLHGIQEGKINKNKSDYKKHVTIYMENRIKTEYKNTLDFISNVKKY